MNFLLKSKGYILHYLVVGIAFLDPSVQAYFSTHIVYAMVGLAVWGSILHWANGKISAPAPKAIAALALLLLIPSVGHSQTSAPVVAPASPTSTFSITANAVTLPGNSVTLAGAESGVAIKLNSCTTTCVQAREVNINAPGVGFYGAGVKVRLPVLSAQSNNFAFYLIGNLGADKVSNGSHWAGTAGIGLNYKLAGSSTWSFGGQVEYARLPGFSQQNTVIISVGPTINF